MNLMDLVVISIKNMFAKCPEGRLGTADEVANVAELLLSDKGAFITGSMFLTDGGATASYWFWIYRSGGVSLISYGSGISIVVHNK